MKHPLSRPTGTRRFLLLFGLVPMAMWALAQETPPPQRERTTQHQEADVPIERPREMMPPRAPGPPRERDPGPPFHLQATVFQVTGAREALLALDANALAGQCKSRAELLTALQSTCDAQTRIGIDQVLMPDRPFQARLNSDAPYAATMRLPDGKTIKQNRSTDTSASLEFYGSWPSGKAAPIMQGQLELQVNAFWPMTLQDSSEGDAVAKWRLTQQQSTALVSGKPAVLITVDGSSIGPQGHSIALVTWILVTKSDMALSSEK